MTNLTTLSTSKNLCQWQKSKRRKSLSTLTLFRSQKLSAIKHHSKSFSFMKRMSMGNLKRVFHLMIGSSAIIPYLTLQIPRKEWEIHKRPKLIKIAKLKMKVYGLSIWVDIIWFTELTVKFLLSVLWISLLKCFPVYISSMIQSMSSYLQESSLL